MYTVKKNSVKKGKCPGRKWPELSLFCLRTFPLIKNSTFSTFSVTFRDTSIRLETQQWWQSTTKLHAAMHAGYQDCRKLIHKSHHAVTLQNCATFLPFAVTIVEICIQSIKKKLNKTSTLQQSYSIQCHLHRASLLYALSLYCSFIISCLNNRQHNI